MCLRLAMCLLVLVPAAARAQSQFFDSNGVRIRFVDQGQGPPVVLIHGYTGDLDRHFVSNGVLPALAKDHRVIALDCRGHGQSDKPHDAKAYGVEMELDVVRLLDHLKIPRAHIVGFSMGAMMTAHLLTTHPDRFLTAALVGSAAVRSFTAKDAEQAEAMAKELEGPTPFRSLILGISPSDQPMPSEEAIQAMSKQLVSRNDPKAMAALNRGHGSAVVSDTQLRAVRVPTIAIVGSADGNLEAVKAMKVAMPALKLVVVDGAAHGGERGVLRRPEFLAELRQFLRTSR